jgi:hypothetical protein
MPETLKLSSKCPVFGDDLIRVDLDGEGRKQKCIIRSENWYTGVFPAISKAEKWVKKVCKDIDTFMEGAQVKSHSVINIAGQKQRLFTIHNPVKNWCASNPGKTPEEAWYNATGDEEYRPPKIEVVVDEDDRLTPDDDATSGFDDKTENPGVDEILAEGRSQKAKQDGYY